MKKIMTTSIPCPCQEVESSKPLLFTSTQTLGSLEQWFSNSGPLTSITWEPGENAGS